MRFHSLPRAALLVSAALVVGLCLGAAATCEAQDGAQLIYPLNGAADVDLTHPFQWTAGTNAQRYYLYVGSHSGMNDLVNTGEIQQTSYSVQTLPFGQILYARLWTEIAGAWSYRDSTFTVPIPPAPAAITYPPNGLAAADVLQPIQWNAVTGAGGYYLYVGTTPGAKNLINSGVINQTSYSGRTLPLGQMVYARLWTLLGGVWKFTDSSFAFQAFIATIASPPNGATDVDPYPTITWTPVQTADAYYLFVGTSPGANDVVDTGEIHTTSYQPAVLPPGVTLYERMWTKSSGQWRFVDAQFSTAPVAHLITPCRGCSNVAPIQTPFTWTAVPAAQKYVVYVGSTPGGYDVVNSGETLQTSYSATLPSQATLYARLWTQAGAIWRYVDSQFTTAPVARLTSPCSGCTNVDPLHPFTWSAIAGAQAYVLSVGTTAGASDLVSTIELAGTSYQAPPLPVGRTLYTRLWTKVDGAWRFVDGQFATATVAVLTSASVGAVGVDPRSPFAWSSVSGATAYYLYVGTSPGSKDLIDTGELSATTYTPKDGWSDRSSPSKITWTAPDDVDDVAGYSLDIDNARIDIGLPSASTCPTPPGGSGCLQVPLPPRSPGSHNISVGAYNSFGETVSAPVAFADPGSSVYARLWTQVAGGWHYADTAFTTATLAAQFLNPAFGAVDVDPKQPIHWTAVPGAEAYSLAFGRAAGSGDILVAGDLHDTSYPASSLAGLPATTLFGQIGTKVNGVWRYSSTMFRVLHVASLIYPANGETYVPTSVAFVWSVAAGDQAYYLYVGTTPGARDIVDSGELSRAFRFSTALPPGTTLYARLWTKTAGVWRFADSHFATR